MHLTQYRTQVLLTCQQNKALVTPLRETVLDLILNRTGVVKAYDVLADMQKLRGNVAPPTVYRALDFWADQGVLHKVAAVNGYVLCQNLHDHEAHHHALILLCNECGEVKEVVAGPQWQAFKAGVADQGFVLADEHMVLTGMCQRCQQTKQ